MLLAFYVSLIEFCIVKKVKTIAKHISGKAIILSCLLFAIYNISSAQIRFSASAPKAVALNQNFQITFTIENGQPKTLTPPSFADFQVLGGPNESSSMQWINGKTSQSVSYSYVLRPKKEGTFKINKAGANIEGANMEANELSITVTPPVQQQAQQRRDPFGDPFGDDPMEQQAPQQSNGDAQKQLKENVFVRLVTDKSSVYTGEKVTATLKIYFRLGIGNLSMPKAPTFDGFWSQEIQGPKEKKPTIETVNGQQYNVAEIQQYNLYPQKSGNLNISAAELNMIVQVPRHSRSIFDNFFGPQAQNVEYKASSNAVALTVKELPSAGKPENFSGAVGRFSYDVKLSAKEGKTDDAVTYTVKVAGAGNLKTIDISKPELPDGFEIYDPKTKEDIANTAAGMSGSKQYDYLIIPRQPGEYKIPGTTFSYFDPTAAKYITLSSPELSLKVTGAPSQNPNTNQAVTNKEDISNLHSDIRYIKTGTAKLEKSPTPFFGSAGYVGLVASPFLLFIGLIFVKRKNEDMAADLVGAKRRRATKLAQKRLSTAQKHLTTGDKPAFYDEVSRAMWGYVGDKLNIDQSQLSKENVEEKLLTKNVKADTISKLKTLISICEQALYSPIGAGDEMKQNYEVAINLITNMEDEIK